MIDKTEPSNRPKRSRRKHARPDEIIEAGLAEFATHGFAATRMEDVARRAGVAKGTVYLYFADKEQLFIAAVESRLAPVLEQADPMAMLGDLTTAQILTLFITMVHDRLRNTQAGQLLRILISEGAAHPKLSALYHERLIARGKTVMRALMARGIARGEVREGAFADLPILIMAPAIMSVLWNAAFDRHEAIAADQFLAAHLDMVLAALRPQDSTVKVSPDAP